MKSKLIYPMVLAVSLAACGGRNGAKAANQQSYETVQEGSAAGVTSTISGPGETLPPITGTNADTTTAFAMTPTVAPNATSASALPPMTADNPTYPPPMMSSIPAAVPVAARPATPARIQRQPAPEHAAPAPDNAQPAEPEPTPEPTMTAEPAPAQEQPAPQPTEDDAPENSEQTESAPPPPPAR